MRITGINFALVTIFLAQSALAGTVFTDRTQWEEAAGGSRVSEDFAGIPNVGGLPRPVTVAWGTVTADFGNVFGGPSGGLSIGSIDTHLIPIDPESVDGFGFDVDANEFNNLRVRVSDGTSVILDTIINEQSFFGWMRGASDGFAFVTVNVPSGLVRVFDATFAFAPPPRFSDVQPGDAAFTFIEALAASGISAGCGDGNYCPARPVTRAEMAVFLERGIHGSNFNPPPATGNSFLDVGASDFAAAYIEQFLLDGITSGCGGNNYCPNDAVTRAEMAVFLLRAKHGGGYVPPPPTGIFGDVDLSYSTGAWIEQLSAEGITGGCGGGNYCPENPVTRAQMAVFLVRTFEL